MRALTCFTFAVLGAASLVLVACSDDGQPAPQEAGVPRQEKEIAPRVATMKVQPRRVVVHDELPGRVSALRTAEIRPQVSGIVRKVLFTEGAEVAAGQPCSKSIPHRSLRMSKRPRRCWRAPRRTS